MNLNMDITIVAAVSKNGVIGKNGTLPWSLPTDLRHFKALTENGVVIMGRKTFESLGNKPLPKRHNIVVSKSLTKVNLHKNLSVVASLDEALWEAQEDFKEAFIIGGSALYKEGLLYANKMVITHVNTHIKYGTAQFPYINLNNGWAEISNVKSELNNEDDYEYYISVYNRPTKHNADKSFAMPFAPITYGEDIKISTGTFTGTYGTTTVGVGTSIAPWPTPTYSSGSITVPSTSVTIKDK